MSLAMWKTAERKGPRSGSVTAGASSVSWCRSAEIDHQGGDFVERVALGRDEHRHQAGRVYRQEFGGPVLALQDVYSSEFVVERAFLEHPLDERCAGEVTPIENIHRVAPGG